jgi:hypothetical protein
MVRQRNNITIQEAGRRFWLAGFVAVLLASSLLATAGPAWASSPLSWASPVPIDDQPPFAYPTKVSGVSCLSTGLCVAVDGVGDVLTSTNPRGGTGAWARAKVTEGFNGVSCPSTEMCVAVGEGVIATSADPAGGAGAWSVVNVSRHLKAVSCASVSLCVATDNHGDVWTSTDPTGGARAWSEVHVDEEALGGVSCPSVKLCVAVGSEYGGDVVTATDPTGGAGAWTVTEVDSGNTLYDVSCSSESLCVATDNNGDVLTSTDPTGGASAWSNAHVSGGLIEHVSCASWGLCVALNGNEVITSTEPTGGSGAWTSTRLETAPALDGASCPAANLCVLADSSSGVVTSTEPTHDAGTWTITPVEVGYSVLQGVSCASVEMCVWVDDAGNVVTSVDPAGGSGAWVGSHVDAHALNSVSCPSTGFCVAVDDAGDVLSSTDPTAGAGAWSIANVDGAIPLNEVSCASVHLCVAIDREGDVVSSNDPTGGASAWSVAQVGDSSLDGVSCPSEGLCVLADGGDVITSTEPAGGTSKWTARDVDAGSLGRISCPSVSLCVATGERPEAVVSWGDPTSGPWAEVSFEDLNGLGKISCAAGGPCVATSFGGEGPAGNVAISFEPAGGAKAWVMSNVYGEPVGTLSHKLNLGVHDMTGVSCTSEGMCIVGDTEGRVMVGTPQPTTTLENTVLPEVLGTPAVGETLTCADGAWTGEPAPTFTVQWLRDGAPISGATGSIYVVQSADSGESLSCEVTATNSAEHKSATGAGVSVPALAPESTVLPAVSGTAAVGGTLTCANGVWAAKPSPMFTVQWLRDGVPISGATGSSYQVQVAEVGEGLACEVTAMNSARHKSATSRSVSVAGGTAPEDLGVPVVSGTPAVGETLDCVNGTWTGKPTPTFTDQWLRDGVPIPGAIAGTYEVQAADAGDSLACEVTATNSAGHKSATSNTLQVPAAQAPSGGGSSGGGSLGGGSLGDSDSSGTLTSTVSNAFVLNGMASVAAHGTVKLTLTLPGPGTLQIVGEASAGQLADASTKKKRKTTVVIARLRLTVSKAGRIVLTLIPTASAKAILARRGKFSAALTITYTPKGGEPRSITQIVTFRLKRRR